jgi:DNA processing protein
VNDELQSLFPEPRRDPGKVVHEDPAATLSLFNAPGVGSARFRALLGAFGSPSEALKAGERALKNVPGVDAVTAASIHTAGQNGEGAKLVDLLEKCGGQIVCIWDEDYPRRLKEIHDPPALLFVRGELPRTDEPCVAIVGTRNPSMYGIKQAHVIASDLASAGIVVASGMARGVDSSAHEGALQAKGRTYAVFGCGIDVIYPSENKSLAEKIIASGALISEFLPGTPPDPGLFPRRNRIISGMSLGVLVVQGSETSGAMITARCALEQNREVFALPGSVEDRRSRGPHQLLRDGAALVESAQDILKEFGAGRGQGQPAKIALPPLNPSEEAVVARLSSDPIHIDQLVRDLNLPVASVLADLLGLEMKGWVQQLPGKLFVRYEPR